MEQIFQQMLDKWPAQIVARTEVPTFTGGMMTEKYQANLDSAGLGPPGRIRCGRKIIYNVRSYVEWLAGRSEFVTDRHRE